MKLWIRQLAGVLRLELKRTAFSRRGWWIYCLAAAPVFIALMHWLVQMRRVPSDHSIGQDSIIFAGLFQFLFLRGSIFFGCMGLFSNLFRGEMIQKTLHYYLLTPIRRELLVIGKYVSGLVVSLLLFVTSAAGTYLLLGRHFGPSWSEYLWHGPGWGQLESYIVVTALACVGYGAVFLLSGILFKNPMIPAVVVWVWENLNPFLPAFLKKISVIFYLRSLCPVEVPAEPPFSVMVVDADPIQGWIAILGLLAVSALILAYAAIAARQKEINYGE
jgi:hypothetical protein